MGDLAGTSPLKLGPSGWRTGRMTKIYDLGPEQPAASCYAVSFVGGYRRLLHPSARNSLQAVPNRLRISGR